MLSCPHEASLSLVIELVIWGGPLFPGLQELVIKPDELQRYNRLQSHKPARSSQVQSPKCLSECTVLTKLGWLDSHKIEPIGAEIPK